MAAKFGNEIKANSPVRQKPPLRFGQSVLQWKHAENRSVERTRVGRDHDEASRKKPAVSRPNGRERGRWAQCTRRRRPAAKQRIKIPQQPDYSRCVMTAVAVVVLRYVGPLLRLAFARGGS